MTLAVSGALQFTELASLLIVVPFLDFSNTDKKMYFSILKNPLEI